MSMLRILLAVITFTTVALPGAASAREAPGEPAIYASTALSDAELGDVAGQGSPRDAFWKASAHEQAMLFDQQSSAINRITFDIWFNDVGSPLIWNNVLQLR